MYSFFTSNEIKPGGWLKRQLEIQTDGLSGNLDKVWPDVRDSAWIGGSREGWERVPYWLDGFIPLAYLLENKDLIARAKKYMDAILSRQNEDGWICPCPPEKIPTYDCWAVLLISKVLTVYYACSKDERIPGALYRMMKNFYHLMETGTVRLFDWGKFRWFEGLIAVNFLKERYPEKWLDALSELLAEQGHDYTASVEKWKRPLNKWTFETHVVNLAMMLKTEAVTGSLCGGKYTGQAEMLYDILMAYNGTPVDIFTGDECLSGLSPIQGTELCAVAELMYSFELLYAYTGDIKWAERLEKVAFNAFPATNSDDMWTHQYVQMSNQISVERFPRKSVFRTNGPEAHLFGLEPNYGCCTANFSQAWPKLCLSTFLYGKDEVISALPIPSSLKTEEISVTLDTEYPFRNTLVYTVRARKDMTFRVRVPSFAENLSVNGEKTESTGLLSFPIEKEKDYRFEIRFSVRPQFNRRPHGLTAISCGSLVFALPVSYEKRMYEYEKDGVPRVFPYCDYEYVGTSEWRYGIAGDRLTVEEGKLSDIPFSSVNPPVRLKVRLKPIAWDYEDGYETVAGKYPEDATPVGDEVIGDFIPYGCAKLRLTELPFCK